MIRRPDGRILLSQWDVGVPDTGTRYPNWETVYADNANWVYRMIFARVGNSLDAEDLTAEVFLAALRPLRITATVAQVRGYLRATTRTVLAAHWRQTIGCETTSIDDLPAGCHRQFVHPRVLEPRVQRHPHQPVDLLPVGHDAGHVQAGNAWHVRHPVPACVSISDDRRRAGAARRYSGRHQRFQVQPC